MAQLSSDDVERFVHDGFVRLEAAFPTEVAARCVDELWMLLDEDRHDPSTWTAPVLRIGGAASPAIVEAINTDRLIAAVDDLVGVGRWQRRRGYGSFPVRFPSEQDPGDAGWHIDGSYPVGDEPPPWNYWVNLWSRGRALLVLMLYSDVGDDDAPTRLRVGSHLDVARTLTRYGEEGASFVEVSQATTSADRRTAASATGLAGDAYLCHPFVMHAATFPHRGTQPRFLGQPAIEFTPPADRYDYERPRADLSPCERAVRIALDTRSSS